jgi:hypothetical protein
MKRAKGIPRMNSFSRRKWNQVKAWSSGLQLCIQNLAGILIGTEQLAKPKIVES